MILLVNRQPMMLLSHLGCGNGASCNGRIRIVNGKNCSLLQTLSPPAGYYIIGSSPVAIADLDNDGRVEIVTLTVAFLFDGRGRQPRQ